ncbi:MAG: hypothetical protein HETSPECPRED_005044 [Heterodermia speciosa]|uniref:Glucose-methanol-choline oxidoreductase N-terminal domain-containing protein n=1 Tax=Heterodermia speciosa TaxID=116794 RepID=A0A8H3FJZ6_9LECA|nr:MAG: hypothetical protein HETSPECPRED_005044 [Heterodermia speciosa]
MAHMDASYDFIIVGGGPAGCVLASRLSASLTQCQILLIEAGGPNTDLKHQSFGTRYWTLATAPGYDWAYKTVPQEHLQGREISYSRGRGMGGSTAINFCVFTRGPKADYDQWAHDVDDDAWSWQHALERFRKLESFGSSVEEYQAFVNAPATAHGFQGPLKVGLPQIWDAEFGNYLRAISANDAINLDHNSGNPLGMAVCQVSALDGRRTTASDAFLHSPPTNLTIMTNSPVAKILFDQNSLKAVGVETSEKKFYARKEVILCTGALDTPKLLLLSGIGPREELARHGIEVIHHLPGVGKNLRDRLWVELVTVQKPNSHHRSSYIDSPATLEEARTQYLKDKSGPLSDFDLPQMIAYLKSERLLNSKDFSALDTPTQQIFQAETRPHFELISHIGTPTVRSPEHYLATVVAFMNPLSSGTVTLTSPNPTSPASLDPNFLSDPFDRRIAIEAVREALDILDTPALANDRERIAAAPKGGSDDEILEYIQATSNSMWHMSGTVKMGRPGEADACVDRDCRVAGVRGLRVVDMSVAPLLISAHTQAVAYLIGATVADKMLEEYAGV